MQCLEVTPSQVGFPGARLAARLETRVKRAGQWTREVVFLLSSLTLQQLQAAGMLRLKRRYWVIESRLHHCLDMTMQEDLSRVRTPNSALVLGIVRRVVLSLSNAGGGHRPQSQSQNQVQRPKSFSSASSRLAEDANDSRR